MKKWGRRAVGDQKKLQKDGRQMLCVDLIWKLIQTKQLKKAIWGQCEIFKEIA